MPHIMPPLFIIPSIIFDLLLRPAVAAMPH